MLRRDDRERGSRTKVTELKVEKSLILQNHQKKNVCHGTWPKKSFPNFRFFMIFVIFLILNNNSQRKLKLLHPL